MKTIIFTDVYIKRVSYSTHSSYMIVKGQGLHHSGLLNYQESRSAIDHAYFKANISYNCETKKYQLESKVSVLSPTVLDLVQVSDRIGSLLRKEGLYKAEYSQDNLIFSNLNN